MAIVVIVVPGEPVAKGRPRIVRNRFGPGVRAITPEKTKTFEGRVRDAAAASLGRRAPLTGRCELLVRAVFSLPRSRWKKREPVVESLREGRPDVDNLLKAVADALNGMAYLDDRQVARAHVEKLDSAQGEPGRTEITITPLDGEWQEWNGP